MTEASAESGFDKVFFYFKRNSTVYDSYMPKALTAKNALTGLTEDSHIFWKTNTVSEVSANVITVTADDNIHIGGLAKVGGVIYTIKGVNAAKTQVTLSGNPPAAVKDKQVLFAIGHVVDHVGTETEGTSKIAATELNPNPYGLGYYSNSPDDDDDLMLEKVSTGTTRTLWYGLINSRNIPDGAIEIHYVAFDKAGNMSHGSVTNAFVKNNGPRLASLRVWTDYNGNESGYAVITNESTEAYKKEFENENDTKYYSRRDRKIDGKTVSRATAVTENLIVTGNDMGIEDGASAFMRVTDQTKFYPEIVGGNGALYFSYRIGSGTDSTAWTIKGNGGTTTPFAAANRTGYVDYSDVAADYMVGSDETTNGQYVSGASTSAIDADLNFLNSVHNGNKWFEYTIWDSTGEAVPDFTEENGKIKGGTLSAKFTVLLNVATEDTTAPKAVISPFYWNSSSDNSLYQNSKNNGHIELENDLSTTVSDLYGDDPKVSGKITIRGTAYDDIRLSQLWVKFDNITALAGATSQAATSGYVQAATYTKSTATWSPAAATMADNGWEFTATDVYCNKDGHLVKWELSINTAKVADVSALNKKAYIIALAERGTGANGYSSTSDSGTAPANGDYSKAAEDYNKPSYQMDILPYITQIETTKRNKGGLKDNNIRSASGKYSIIYAAGTNATNYPMYDQDFITVRGFNLNPSAVRVVNSTLAVTKDVAVDSGIAVTSRGVDTTNYTYFSLRNVITKSGYLEVFTNGNRALNNINNNDSYGTAVNSSNVQLTKNNAQPADFEKAYNREADYYTTKNVRLTDDRYLLMWDMKQTNVTNGYYPVMVMEGDDPVFGYIDNNGGGAEAGSSPASAAKYQRAKFNGDTGAEIYKEYLGKSLSADQMAMVKDGGGRYIHFSVSDFAGDNMWIFYDRYAELYTNSNVSNGNTWYQYFNGNYGNQGNNNAIALESIGSNVGRIQYPKMQVKGNSRTGAASIYLIYYDAPDAKFYARDFMIGTATAVGNTYQLNNTGKDNNNYNFEQYINFNEGDTAIKHAVSVNNTDLKGYKYYDFAVTSDNHMVLVYYNEDESKLKLVYSAAVTGSNPTDNITWTASTLDFPEYVGSYVSLALDSAGGVHISAFDVSDSDLSYIYLTSYNADSYTHMTVDQFAAVGNWTKIKVNSSNVPYIAYTNATENGQRDAIKLAYADAAAGSVQAGIDTETKTKYTTGHWEYMTVSVITPPQGGDSKFQNVCLDFDSAGKPVIGYLGSKIEFGKWRDE